MNIGELRIGAKIALGSYDGADIIWRKVSDECDFMSDERICRTYFDSHEPRSDSRARRSHGNNFYPHSNIHHWLNASAPGWYKPQHEYDEPPSYSSVPGFLCKFSVAERNALVEQELTVAVPLGSKKKFGKTVSVKALVALPSSSQCGDSNPEIACEGARLPEINNIFDGWKASLTRTGYKDAGHVLLYGRGWVDTIAADDAADIHPMIRINPGIVVTDVPDNDGVYWTNLYDAESVEGFLSFISD